MTTTPKNPNRWRRSLIYVGIAVFTLFVGVPTAHVILTRAQIASALRSASSVRLEEHSFDKVLSTHQLAPAEFQRVSEAIPITPDFGIPGLLAMCFIPHHRVIIADASQQQKTFEVCFSCEQVQLSGRGTPSMLSLGGSRFDSFFFATTSRFATAMSPTSSPKAREPNACLPCFRAM